MSNHILWNVLLDVKVDVSQRELSNMPLIRYKLVNMDLLDGWIRIVQRLNPCVRVIVQINDTKHASSMVCKLRIGFRAIYITSS